MKLCIATLFCLLLSTAVMAASFVNPIGFEPTTANKAAVVEYIKQNVKEEYSKINMDSASVLLMMEKQNLDAFKQLTKAQDTKLLARVIKEYCSIGMCNYSTILMMYQQELKAKGQSLQW